MAKRKNDDTEGLVLCRGGRSFICKRISEEPGKDSPALGPHEAKQPIYCRRCKAYMGCFWCAARPAELICLNCRDWARDDGEREHGPMLVRQVVVERVHELVGAV